MSGCTRCRWGTNTNPDRPVNTENAKQLESGLQNLLAERQNMDTMWAPSEVPAQTPPQPKPTVPSTTFSSSAPIPIPKRPEPTPSPSTTRPPFFEPSKPPQKKNYAGVLYN
jgi:hypothetical protein